MINMRKTFLTSCPSCNLVADIRARVIWETPVEHMDHDVKVLGAFRLAEPLMDRRLHQTMNRKHCQVACSIDEGCSEEFLRSITNTAQITSAQSLERFVEIAGLHLLHFVR